MAFLKHIFYSLFLLTLVASCNKTACIPTVYELHQDTKSAAKETADEVETHEDVALAVVPIPYAAREPIIDRYIHFTFGRGVNEPNDNGDTPLMEAIKNPDIDETSMFMLLEHPGIDLDRRAQDTAEHTALHLAAIHGRSDVVRTLLDKGADVNAKTRSWRTALGEGKELLIMLDNDEHTALHVAAIYGKSDVVRTLLDKGADVNAKTRSWRTALHEAAIHGKSDVVRILLDKGADVNAKTRGWWTALHMAAKSGKSDIVSILLDKGADVNAIRHRYDDCIPLLDKGVRVNKKPDTGGTALSAAISNGHQEVTKLLRDAGAR